jgi:hypothetical protein
MTGAIAFAALIVWGFARETAPARTGGQIPAKEPRPN